MSVVFSENIVLDKSPGPDDINSKILVELAKSVAPSSLLFQNFLWYWNPIIRLERANITPIYKKDDKKDPESYCLVSLASILCKIMESIIKDHLLT